MKYEDLLKRAKENLPEAVIAKERFEKDLKVTIQALGWMSGGRYLPLQDNISSVAFWYQEEPHAKFPKLPEKDFLEVH